MLAVSGEEGKVGPQSDARVVGEVVEEGRGAKILVFHYKRKKQYKKLRGHRQAYTAVRISEIAFDGQSFKAPELPKKEAKPKKVKRAGGRARSAGRASEATQRPRSTRPRRRLRRRRRPRSRMRRRSKKSEGRMPSRHADEDCQRLDCKEFLMAHKKGQGTSRNGRDSNAQRLGFKAFGGQIVPGGTIIVRQRGTPREARTQRRPRQRRHALRQDHGSHQVPEQGTDGQVRDGRTASKSS